MTPACASVRPQDLPSIDTFLRSPTVAPLVAEHGHTLVARTARALLADLRKDAVAGDLGSAQITTETLVVRMRTRLDARLAPRQRAVINLTGTVLHTNLGRTRLADAALEHLRSMLTHASNLEYDLESGARGERDDLVAPLLCELTGAEAATVVNNNAAAVLLTLAALAAGGEVIVSRGELVEIGGSFRLPDVMQSAGATLVEVGTTNRTHARDYERAINPQTALLMKVHTSNYAIQGFTASVAEAELSAIARAHGLPLASDLGSGALVDLSAWDLPREPMPQDMLRAGCDVVTFSGDKLLGGPQAGLIVGKTEWVERIRKHPMKRALRTGKLTLAALAATLQLYLRPERLPQDLPTLRLLTRPLAAIQTTAQALQPALQAALAPYFSVKPVALQSQIGSGSLPVERLPSAGLAIAPTHKKGSGRALAQLSEALRALPTPVIGRINEDRLLLDLRCLEDVTLVTRQLHELQLPAM
jgi:L-seryl-tRNA(Ser) seleniumtransferase